MQKVEEMSAYERERAEHIARNKERMAALHLPSLANSMAPKKEARPAKQRGISSKRHKAPVGRHLPSKLNHLLLPPNVCKEAMTVLLQTSSVLEKPFFYAPPPVVSAALTVTCKQRHSAG